MDAPPAKNALGFQTHHCLYEELEEHYVFRFLARYQ